MHLVDHRFQPLAEEDAVGQAAQRIVHGQMTQARFAGGDRHGGAAHVAQHEGGEQREAGERDGDERNDAVDDLGARLFRRPGKARDFIAARAVHLIGEIAVAAPPWCCRSCANSCSRNCVAMLASASLSMNFTDITIGAASSRAAGMPSTGPTATAAMIAGRPSEAADYRRLRMRAAFGQARRREADRRYARLGRAAAHISRAPRSDRAA